jgi:hypothetical protein
MADFNLESILERKCCKDLEKNYGILNIKLYRLLGWPDRLFFRYGRILFVEFKRSGQRPRKIQQYIHDLLRTHFFSVYVVDDYDTAISRITEYFND